VLTIGSAGIFWQLRADAPTLGQKGDGS
jgi:hypothetical protein